MDELADYVDNDPRSDIEIMLDKYDCDFEALADELGCSEKDIENELNSTY